MKFETKMEVVLEMIERGHAASEIPHCPNPQILKRCQVCEGGTKPCPGRSKDLDIPVDRLISMHRKEFITLAREGLNARNAT